MESSFYIPNAALLTDFYQVVMAHALFLEGRANCPSVFHLYFRQAPFNNQWALTAGINDALSFVKNFKFDAESLSYLAQLKLFNKDFITYLEKLKPNLDIYGLEDGDIVFANEPILRVEGPLALCMLLETPLLTIINFQTLIATKAARIKEAAKNKKVVDFGLRRAQGFNGAISATKAAFIGGIDATSNIWAAKHFDIPLSGSQSHSFVMSFKTQAQAFKSFTQAATDSCILICDTYETLEGVREAIKALGEVKKNQNKNIRLGIRLDSGNLLSLSIKARAMLNDADLAECVIVASGDLDEFEIDKLTSQNAPIDIFGVGTRLICAYGDPALGGVYKLAAIYDHKHWRDTYKISNDPIKASLPGRQALMRFSKDEIYAFDQVFDPEKSLNLTQAQQDAHYDETLLTKALMKQGENMSAMLELGEAKKRAQKNLLCLPPELRKLRNNSFCYSVFVDKALKEKKEGHS